MTIKTNFLQPGSYNAADLVAEFGALFTDGMLSGGAVTAHSPANLSVDVAILKCLKAGLFMNSDAIVNVAIGANTSGYNRIDVIAADLDNQTIIAVQGTPSSSPTAPILTANKIALAQVLVGNNVSVINTGNITDVRVNVDLFGLQLAGKASITLENLNSPTLINSWVNDTSGNYDGVKYYKDTLGIVHIQGRITGGTLAQDAFALPSGYRPAKDQVFVLGSNIVLIKATGGFNIVSGTSPFNLNGITFRAGA